MGKNPYLQVVINMVSFRNGSFHSMMFWKRKNQRGNVLIECPATYQEDRLQSLESQFTHSPMHVYE